MAAPRRFTVTQVVDTLNQSKGMVYLAAKLLGCCPNTVYNYANRHARVRDAIAQQQGQRLDEAELALITAVRKGEAWAVCFTLKTLGKQRGFIERPAYEPPNAPESILDQVRAMDSTIQPPGMMPLSNGNGHASNGKHKKNGKPKKNGKAAAKNGNGKA